MKENNVVIAAVPYIDTMRPMAAPAVLKASLSKVGIKSTALDLNVDIERRINQHPYKNLFIDFFTNQTISKEIIDELDEMINYCANEILQHNPSIVALSLFCYHCQHFTAWLCAALRQKSPDIKIVIGGPGIQVFSGAMVFDYPGKLKRLGFIDDYITGDGELSFVEYVKGNTNYPGINSSNWQPVEDLNLMPIPDYSDYKWFKYGNKCIPIIDSRGCVQDCEFCDVIAFWKKFQFLSAENIFNQMLYLMKQHQFSRFDFRSSVSNGNFKEFKKLLQLISDWNHDVSRFPSEKIIWDGSFIVRSSKTFNDEFWELLKKSNPERLFVGVESVVEHVRIGLGKKFTNDDLDYFLAKTQQYEIPIDLLLIAGYPSENINDYEFSKNWFRQRKHFANNTVMGVQVTSPGILPGTKLETTIDIKNFNNLAQQRIDHRTELIRVITEECGFSLNPYEL